VANIHSASSTGFRHAQLFSEDHVPLKDSEKAKRKPLTLHPLSFEEALEAALQVEPPPKPEKKGRVKKEKPSPTDREQRK
jgi:hypothetical protein